MINKRAYQFFHFLLLIGYYLHKPVSSSIFISLMICKALIAIPIFFSKPLRRPGNPGNSNLSDSEHVWVAYCIIANTTDIMGTSLNFHSHYSREHFEWKWKFHRFGNSRGFTPTIPKEFREWECSSENLKFPRKFLNIFDLLQ